MPRPGEVRPLRVSIVIPTLNAAHHLPALLASLQTQALDGGWELVVVDSASDDQTVAQLRAEPRARVIPIAREAFTHGYARNLGVREARGDMIVFLSQDALPRDAAWLSALIAPFDDSSVAAAFSRQIPYPDANPIEQTFIGYWFPAESRRTRGVPPGAQQDLRFIDVFFSNVSSAARRDILLAHPFLEDLIMSEDQQFARDVLRAGHDVVYQAASMVWHSHTYTLRQIFQRYFDSAFSLTHIFNHTVGESLKAGRGYLPHEFRTIVARFPTWIPYYLVYFIAKGAGVFAGHAAPHLPRRLARACSLHKRYWDEPWKYHAAVPAPPRPPGR
jgi:rhamnosyltransferase